ncbi:MAG: hypothetical protein NT069_21440 [Planctomycetota bacterium]|nr:hypothetical protein [Planctomycetota bacterium]
MWKRRVVCLVALFTLEIATARSQDESATPASTETTAVDVKEIDAELDAFRDDLFRAFNDADYPTMLEKYCHKDLIATWQDGTTGQGHAGVIAEFDKLKKFIRKMTVHPKTDKRLILNDGKLVISSGDMEDEYALSRGPRVNLKSRWSATLVKEDGRWLLASFSASTNAFDNEVVDLYLAGQKYTWVAIGGLVGLVLGIGVARTFSRKDKPNAPRPPS